MSTTTTTTTTTTTDKYNTDYCNPVVVLLRARARERAQPELTELYRAELDAYADYWRQTIGTQLPPAARRRIAAALAAGIEAALIADLIDQTAGAPRPSWAYCAAIMDRIEREGIKSQADYQAAQERRRAATRPAAGTTGRDSGQDARNYEQRPYDNRKMVYLFEDA